MNTAIIYCDGGCGPTNPGPYGSGAHGYIFNNDTLGKKNGDKPSKYTISNIGYIENDQLLRYEYETVIPLYYIDAVYSYVNVGTNNIAELSAFIEVTNDLLKNIDNIPLNNIIFKTDSKYLMSVVSKVSSNPNGNYTNELNSDYYYLIKDVIDKLNDLTIDYKLVKVEAHSTILGNNIADSLATLAKNASNNRNIIRKCVITPAKKYWNIEDTRHPMLRFKQVFFTNNLRTSNPEIIYSIMEYGKDIDPGKKSNEATFGIVILNNPPSEIEDTIQAYQSKLWSMSVVSVIDMNVLYNRNNIHYYNLFNKDIYTFRNKTLTLHNIDNIPIVFSIRPPGLANQALEKMQVLYNIVKEFRANDRTRTYIDITDKVYDKSGKKVVTLLVNGTNTLKINTITDNKDVLVNLDLGIDTLTRNQFKQLETNDTTVYLVINKVSDTLLEYFTIVSSNDSIGVFCNFYSNKIYIK